jgi:prevent-host-death family protein
VSEDGAPVFRHLPAPTTTQLQVLENAWLAADGPGGALDDLIDHSSTQRQPPASGPAYPPRLPSTARIAILAVMKSVTALEAKNRFGEVLETAQRQPVSITRNGRPSVVMISAESYQRRQRMARERLRQSLQRAGEHAVSQGLNEDVLDQLLADGS